MSNYVVSGLTQKILAGIRPRIPGLNIQPVPLKNSKYVIMIEIPKSFSSPHMVIFNNSFKFYSRTSKEKYLLDVDELRLAFTLAQNIKERIINFRRDRLSMIVSGETPVPIGDGAKLVLHIIPISAFDSVFNIDVKDIFSLYTKQGKWFRPISGGYNHRYNFDGFLIYGSDVPSSIYLQVFRNGIVEALNTHVFKVGEIKNKNLSYIYKNFEETVTRQLGDILNIQQSLGLEPPILIMLSMLRVKNYSIGHPDQTPHDYLLNAHPITEDSLILPEVMIEDYNIDLDKIMKPTFDIVWNAAGYPGSLNYT